MRLALQIGSSRVGAADASLTAAGVQRLRVRLTAAGRRVIDRARRFSGTASLVLRGTATDSAGNRTSRTVIPATSRDAEPRGPNGHLAAPFCATVALCGSGHRSRSRSC